MNQDRGSVLYPAQDGLRLKMYGLAGGNPFKEFKKISYICLVQPFFAYSAWA